MKKYLLIIPFIFTVLSGPVNAQTEIGLQLYSLRNEFKTDVPGTLNLAEKWGIREIEGGDTYGLSLAEYKKLLSDNNLKMISVGAD